MTITRRKLCKWNRMRGKSYLHLAKNNVKCRNGRRGNHVRYINEIRLMKKKAWAFRDSAWRDRGKKCGFSKNWAEAEFLDCPTTGINNYVVKIRRAEFIGVSLTWPQSHTFFSSFSSSFLFSFFFFSYIPVVSEFWRYTSVCEDRERRAKQWAVRQQRMNYSSENWRIWLNYRLSSLTKRTDLRISITGTQ